MQKALNLANVIHEDPAIARRVVILALDRLPAAVITQDKRIYYTRLERAARATKVWLGEEQILQQLVFAISDRAERADESRRAVSEREMLIRFLKHLVWISTRRNAFYVSLAVARLLYGFTTQETAEVYGRLVDDDAKDDDYYRARKRVLIDELSDRFSSGLRIAAGRHGERGFAMRNPDPVSRALIERCLEAFAPWGIACDGDPNDPLSVMHRLLHPVCFRALVMRLAWPDPSPRLLAPRFIHHRSLPAVSNLYDQQQVKKTM